MTHANRRKEIFSKCALPYLSQKKAWSDTKVFLEWWEHVFLPFIYSWTGDPVLLILDNCGPHGAELVDPRGQVTVIMALPPNCTAVHQPMDAGIISWVKTRYRYTMLREVVGFLSDRNNLRRRAEELSMTSGTKGLHDGYDAHLGDVARISKVVWNDLSMQTIARCWVKANMLCERHNNNLLADFGKSAAIRDAAAAKADEIDLAVVEVQQLMKSIDLQSVDDDLNIAELSEVYNDVSNVRKWLDVERDEEVCEAMQSDLHQEFMSGSMVDEGLAAIAQEVESSRVDQEEEVKAAKLPSLPKDVCDSALAIAISRSFAEAV